MLQPLRMSRDAEHTAYVGMYKRRACMYAPRNCIPEKPVVQM